MISVVNAGFGSSLQDMGRCGVGHLGVSRGGALAPDILAATNILLGNLPNTTAIEFSSGTLSLHFEEATEIAICGHGIDIDVSTNALERLRLLGNWSYRLPAQSELRIRAIWHRSIAYIAIANGISAQTAFGSTSTQNYAGFGGHCGRTLQNGDKLTAVINKNAKTKVPLKCPINGDTPTPLRGVRLEPPTGLLRAIVGPEYHHFSKAAHQYFWQHDWTIAPNSNRMGCRLENTDGKTLPIDSTKLTENMRSHAVFCGVVQVPTDGKPIILMVDAQSTGGYPRFATVIQADLWQLSCIPPKKAVRFIRCDQATAIDAIKQRQQATYRLTLATNHTR